MEKKRLFDTCQICCESGQQAKLRYYCLKEVSGFPESYGVLIEMEGEGKWESARAAHITTSFVRIGEILSLLSKNTVTPCTLHEVILDQINNF